jgi:citrate synthase
MLLGGIGILSELCSNMFAMARVGGWTAHCLEQLENSRLIRPRNEYVGNHDREWVPVNDR